MCVEAKTRQALALSILDCFLCLMNINVDNYLMGELLEYYHFIPTPFCAPRIMFFTVRIPRIFCKKKIPFVTPRIKSDFKKTVAIPRIIVKNPLFKYPSLKSAVKIPHFIIVSRIILFEK